MTTNPFLRYVLSPLVVLFNLCLVELASRYYDITASLGIPFAGLALCLFWSGFRANLLSALFITAYALYSDVYDVDRTIQVMFTVWPIAIGGGLLKRWLIESVREAEYKRLEAEHALELADLASQKAERERLRAEENQAKADFVDNLNGNIDLLREINQDLIRLSLSVALLPKEDIAENINLIQDKTANLAQRAIGWQQLAEDKKLVTGNDES